ncbi:MCE family protein [Gordonia pseudamarae]|jgi:phospholipid/cholesterol/gamma-HCH transport system substrate-binding protein|uniref:MCE family protein n=1 Tax=Gordonia pseudamarae TaxID=2831662 RepID=A0ABX6IJ83_9ACTN|nr:MULTISPECIES: MlaD family protein [Gordonia]MBD0023230.1 MCE family protein [Gordonia sp. (in: high G+C Gram-positive bacteria)]QHN27063.1 MCE family protein [Gordonia pseudamarae]QHN35952.1 MCE family protein [Gordonia pseudamarae]
MGGQLAGSIRVIRPLWKLIVAALAALVLYFVIANGITAPYSGSTREYSADFTDATGLRPNADVRIRGVKVGKVTGVELQQTDDNSAVAKVEFTVNQDHSLTTESKAAVRYANLSGVRYLDVTGADGRGERVRHLPTANTVSSFDVTELFNGLQPVLQTLSPEEINDFSNNALTVLQGDGSGLAPLLKSVDELSRYTANREKTISTLVGNMARISDSLGGTSPQILQFLKEIEVPIDSVLTVLDEFRKADKYGPPLMTVLNQLMAAIGLQTTTDLDQELARAFPDINNMWKSMDLFPSVVESMQLPAIASEKTNKCSKGELPLPELGQILVNGSGAVVCRA